jgi:hypothetical protein
MKSLYLFIFILVSPFPLIAQNIHGLWSGTIVNDSTHRTQNFELGLSEYRGKITGYTYTTFIDNDTFYYSIKRIKAERKDGKLVIEDDEMVGNNFPERAAKHVKQTTVFPLINDSTIDITNGKWSTNQTKKYYSISGYTTIREQDDNNKSDLLAHLQEANIKTDIAVDRKKKNENNVIVKNSSSAELQKNNNREVPENKKTDVVKSSEIKSSKIKSNPENEAQRNDAVVINTNTPTQKTALVNNNVAEKAEQNKTEKDLFVSPTKSAVKKDTVSQVVQRSDQPLDKNSEKKKLTNTVSTNIPAGQKKDLVENNKQKEPGSNIVAGQVAIVNNSNSQNPDRSKPKKDQAVSQIKSPVKKDTVVQVVQKTNQPSDNNSEKQKMITTVSTSIPVSQKKDLVESGKELPVIVANRTNENMQDVYFKNDSLVLSLYDNGIVDGDTVSVFLNGEPIFSKQMLKAVATKKTIYISQKMDSVQLVLFAENLGTIPPNTGLLTVRDGDDVYQVRFSADLQRNASIILRRKKE